MENIVTKTDVLVVGGGTAGTIAAIQAASAGVRTVILERNSQLGGVTTVGGVDFPGLFHAWGRQIIAGYGWELVSKTVELGGGAMPDFSVPTGRQHWHHQIRINGRLYAALAEEACLDAGVELLYYEFPIEISSLEYGWKLRVVGKGIYRTIVCKQLIDCTGGADIVGMAGYPRLREATTQPGTLIFRLGGYNVDDLDAALIQERYEAVLQSGELYPGDFSRKDGQFIGFLRSGGENAQHVMHADSSTSATQTHANIEGRQAVLRLLRFVRTLPGCENAVLERMQQETAVRETYRVDGEVHITQEDYWTARQFDDAVSYSFYPIDLHTQEGVVPKHLPEGHVPMVPLRALVPKGSQNMLVAGRSVSSDRMANSALRVQASSMAMGQATGAAAVIACVEETTPLDADLDRVHGLLRDHKAIVPKL